MCVRSAIFCWSNVYTVGPIFTIPNLQRQWVYYDVTDGGRGRMSASISELTSDALYIFNYKFLAAGKVLAKSSDGFD